MKKHLMLTALASALTCAAGSLFAQDQAPPPAPEPQEQSGGVQGQMRRGPMDPDAQAAAMQRRLSLSDDQVTQIKPILADRQQQVMALRDDTSMAQADKMAKMRSIMQDSDDKIKALLNDDQKVKYEAMEQQMRNRMRERWQQRRQGSPEQNQQ